MSVVLSLRCRAMSGLRLTAALRLQVVSLPRCPTYKQNYLCNCNCGNLERSAHSSCGTLLEESAGTEEKVTQNITFFQLYFLASPFMFCVLLVSVLYFINTPVSPDQDKTTMAAMAHLQDPSVKLRQRQHRTTANTTHHELRESSLCNM